MMFEWVKRRSYMLFIYTLAGLLGFASAGFTQIGSLKGKVYDVETHEPLPGANVIVSSEQIKTGTATDSHGQFTMENLPEGYYTIKISYIGYETRIFSKLKISSNQETFLDVALKSTGIVANPITVTASRRPEKLLDAPASITVLEAHEIESRPVLTATEHLKALPAIDIISAGLNQSRVVIRGFNSIFSGSLLSLVDNRITRIPSVRLNAFQLIPTSNDDVERIEIVSGPASALYGPNSANGVVHILTKSPFDSKGTRASLAGGQRNIVMSTFRHAGAFGEHLGYKFSVQYYKGRDFESFDPVEIAAREAAIKAGANPDTLLIGARDFHIKSLAVDARVDFKPKDDFLFIFNTGFSRGTNIEFTDSGAAQAVNAMFKYVQARMRYKNLFFQVFMNGIDTGDTYFLRTGQKIINNSKLFVIQAQHHYDFGEKQKFTYGFDVLLTRPNTKGTVNGKNEDHDDVNEIGAYIQSETSISQHLKIVTAARLDDHNRLDNLNFSPRAALVYKPTATQNLRLTFNRAFSTPTADNLFSDVLSAGVPTAAADPLFIPFIGESLFKVRALGTWPNGFSFRYVNGIPQMLTLYGQYLANKGLLPSATTYLPPEVNPVWPAIRDLIITGAPPEQRPFLRAILPAELSTTVPGVLKILNTETQQFEPVDFSFVKDIAPLKETSTTTWEFGYKGLINKKLLFSADLYHSRIKDFIGPLRVETPHVFVDTDSLRSVLTQDMIARGLPGALAETVAQLISENLADLPIGLISPQEVANPTDVILTYRNFGDITVSGLDLSFTYYLNQYWNISGNYSFVNKDFFKDKKTNMDIALNAPKHKFGAILNYTNQKIGFLGNLRLRFVDSFPVNSGIFVGKVNKYAVLDLNASYTLPFSAHTRITLNIQNLTNNKHREFVGVPEIGRLAILRLSQTL